MPSMGKRIALQAWSAAQWRRALLLSAVLLTVPLADAARAQVVLATSTAPRFQGGSVRCSGVNVGDEPLDIQVELIDVGTGTTEVSNFCADENDESDEDVVEPNRRCTVVSETTAVVFCKITVDIAGGSGDTPNPALALLRDRVRANVTSSGTGAFVVLEAH